MLRCQKCVTDAQSCPADDVKTVFLHQFVDRRHRPCRAVFDWQYTVAAKTAVHSAENRVKTVEKFHARSGEDTVGGKLGIRAFRALTGDLCPCGQPFFGRFKRRGDLLDK
ncbi:MAG: hypothetical protein J6J21_06170, partial [Clostridia bacterium]|nr:hypothetical protein [Clostridia bacterium]